jgi:RNA polymerase sigma factor (sigma-70 family)
MRAEDEQRLVEAAPRDSLAFRQLYNSYFPRVYAYVSYRVGSAQDAEDLVGGIFMKVVEEIDHFRWQHDNSFAAWIFRIAHNQVGNYHRTKRRAAEQLHLDELPQIAAHALLPEEVLLRKETFAHLYSLVRALSARRREVITLKFFGGLSNREIAGILDLDERTVASNLCRALDDLQEQYELAGEKGKRKRYERAR